MTERPTPKTDALREVVIGQYKQDELTGSGMGNILAALADIEELERERDEAREQLRLANIDCYAALTELDAARELADRLAALISKPASEWGWEKVDDLNAMHEAEKTLGDRLDLYREFLRLIATEDPTNRYNEPAFTRARQRAEAYLRTIGKWEEDT